MLTGRLLELENKLLNTARQAIKDGTAGTGLPGDRSWNSQMYPRWQGGDPRNQDCWRGGPVTFDVSNDAPTLTGAKSTFSIQLKFPANQTVLPDGEVVWSENCTINGSHVTTGEPVYADESSEGSKCVFPDGRPFPANPEGRRRRFVYVWQTWGKYWQVIDGPTSQLTVDTHDVSLGSYTMEVTVYHYRGRQKFIPIGKGTSQFAITDQIPFTVSIAQINDVNQADENFIQNRAISFTVQVHDPSQYLKDADVTFSWDFGDNSGTLISHTTVVTHTYLTTGTFSPQLILQAAIPVDGCGTPAGTVLVPTTRGLDPITSFPISQASTGGASVTSEPLPSAQPTGQEGTTVPPSEVPTAQQTTGTELSQPSSMDPLIPTSTIQSIDPVTGLPTTTMETAASAASVDPETPSSPVAPASSLLPGTSASTAQAAATSSAESSPQPSSASSAGSTASVVVVSIAETGFSTTPQGAVSTATEGSDENLLLVKRQVPEDSATAGCIIYRYGSFSTNVNIVQGIEAVEIVQVANVIPVGSSDVQQNAVDITVTCQGSLPTEVCTMVLDSACVTPEQTICNQVAPPPECQLVLRQFFNDSGVYCVNVSMTNGVSLGVASAQVSISAEDGKTPSHFGVVALVGLVAMAGVILGVVAVAYRQMKGYIPLRENLAGSMRNRWAPERSTVSHLFQNIFGRSTTGENSPLLRGQVV
ncbi:melanocyte protein PMEL isoform X2 [Protopterus annectens]|uniref:melanocyte protein PMEL isoform X2 n=1 Tax=Protopterus annectens TaxID=7888 RepID=UPI001CFBA5AF|nr:melanocyte protein PMEL isoform X2 [Protopterus annectens]